MHVIGADITRFHTIYWPMFLHSLDLREPNRIFVHGLLMMKDGKMSKSKGNVVGLVRNPKQVEPLMELGVYNKVIVASATEPVAVLEAALAANDGKEYDISICCVNIESCEMSAILPVRDDGLVYFFSMATSFTKAALGAEGVGKDVTMIVGNGYTKNHAEITLNVLRENPKLRKLFDEKYC